MPPLIRAIPASRFRRGLAYRETLPGEVPASPPAAPAPAKAQKAPPPPRPAQAGGALAASINAITPPSLTGGAGLINPAAPARTAQPQPVQSTGSDFWDFTVTQGFGPTTEPLDSAYAGYAHFNKGYDFATPLGTPVRSPVAGQVVSVGDHGDGWGVRVQVRDAEGLTHNFGHLSAFSVDVGDAVTAGQAVGASGNTGKSTGPHLSYDVWDGSGTYLDPSRFLPRKDGGGAPTSIGPAPSMDTGRQDSPARRTTVNAYAEALPEELRQTHVSVYDAALREGASAGTAFQRFYVGLTETLAILTVAEDMQRQGLDVGLDDDELLRIAEERVRRGEGLKGAMETLRGIEQVQHGTTVASIALGALPLAGFGSALRGPGLISNLLGRGTQSLPRYLATETAAEVAAEATRALAQEAGASGTESFLAGMGGGVLGGSAFGAATRLRPRSRLAPGPEDLDLTLEGQTPPERPLPGQRGMFGEEVDEGGAIRQPPPEMGSSMAPRPGSEFRGEQGGLQPGMFRREEAGSAPGQMGLEEGLRAGPGRPQQLDPGEVTPELTTGTPSPDSTPPVQGTGPTILPAASGIARDRRVVKVSEIEFEPDTFQARDADPGLAFGERRVNEIVRGWDDAQFEAPGVVPHPSKPGKWIVYRGHHRTEAYRRVKGPDAPIEVVVTHADLSNPAHLNTVRLEGDASNFTTATPNVRERIRAVQRAQESGESIEEVADRLRMTATQVDELNDAARLGDGPIDRVVVEPGLEPYIKEIGRGMRAYSIGLADASGLFNRIAGAKKNTRPTPAALRETIDRFGAALQELETQRNQGALFEAGTFEGIRTGLLGIIDENARILTELERMRAALARKRSAAAELADLPGATQTDRRAIQRLIRLAEQEEARLRDLIKQNEEDVSRVLRGEEAQGRALTEPPPPDAGPPLPPEAGGTPPPPPRPISDDPLDRLIAAVKAAGVARPGLLARRREELATRVARAARELERDGLSATEALAAARRQLRGQLADPAFALPASLDAEGLRARIVEAMQDQEVQFFTGVNAQDGLEKLAVGNIPAPHEVEALGQIFGLRLQDAIEEMGDIFKVQRAAERALTGGSQGPIEITLPDGQPVSADMLAEAMRSRLPGVSLDHLAIAAERIIESGRAQVFVRRNGRTAVTLGPESYDALGNAARRHIYEGVPEQRIPPGEPTFGGEDFDDVTRQRRGERGLPEGPLAGQRTVEDVGAGGPGPGETLEIPPQRPVAGPSLSQQRLARVGLEEQARRGPTTLEAATPQRPRPRRDGAGDQYWLARDWKPGKPLTEHIFTGLWGMTSFPKTLMAGFDRAFPFRQGGLLVRHGRQVRDSMQKTMFIAEDAADAAKYQERFGFTPPNAEDVMRQVNAGKWAQVRRNSGLAVEEWGIGAKLHDRNEEFMNGFARRYIPGVAMGERSFVVFLNKLRADVFDSVVEKWLREGQSFVPGSRKMITQDTLDGLARYINAATGRGDLGVFEGAASALARGFFSPRYLISRGQVLAQLFAPNTPGLVRKEIAKDLAIYVGVGMTILGLAELSGFAEVELDPRSVDFGKMRIGPTRIDLWGGHQQIARYTAQLITGQATGSTGGAFDISRSEVVTRFLRSKLSPSGGIGINVLYDEDFIGRDYDLLSLQTVRDTMTPFFIQDTIDAVAEQGVEGLGALPVSYFLAAVQSYTTPAQERNAVRDEASMQRWGVPYAELPDKYPGSGREAGDGGFSMQSAIDKLPEVAQAIEDARLASADTGFGRERAGREAFAAAMAEREAQAIADWRAGTLVKPLPEIWSDLAKERAGARRQAELLSDVQFDTDAFDALLDGYFGQQVMRSGGVDWEQTILAQERYLARLPRADRARIEDFLGVLDRRKTPEWQAYRAYMDHREELGYFAEDITQAERAALDRANPQVDLDSWFWNGGVEGRSDQILNSPQAVEQALAMNLPNREVRYENLARPINQSEQSLAAWEASGAMLAQMETQLVPDMQEPFAQRMYERSYEQLTADEQGEVRGAIRTQARRDIPQLDAWMAWWGRYQTLRTPQALDFLNAIVAEFGFTPPTEDWSLKIE